MQIALRHAPVVFATLLLAHPLPLAAQSSQPGALAVVRSAMAAEMRADLTDKSIWTYREEDDTPAQHATYLTVETRQGTLRRLIAFNGRHLSPRAAAIETTRINDYVHDRYAQEKAQRASAHDAAQARQLLQMLPDAFIWTIVKQTPENTTLRFQPNPQFNPPDTEARVMGAMSGEMVVARKGDRIRSLHGALTHNVLIGWGILARLYGGGTFDVERRGKTRCFEGGPLFSSNSPKTGSA